MVKRVLDSFLHEDDNIRIWEDPEEALEHGIVDMEHLGTQDYLDFADWLEERLETCPDDDCLIRALHRVSVLDVFPPDGDDLRAWVRHVVDKTREWASHPDDLPTMENQLVATPPLPRVSRFLDKADANRICTDVLRAHRSLVEAWDGTREHPRLHVYADLSTLTGRVLQQGRGRDEDEVTAAVVVLAGADDGRTRILTAYPELSLDTAWRERFPDLCHFLGGWTHQDWQEQDGALWLVWQRSMAQLQEPARARTHAQLGELLDLPDDQLRAANRALGSYYDPEHDWRLRNRLRRMHWRLHGL